MANKFDAESYIERWEGRIIPLMLAIIAVSLVLVIYLNIATRPDCLRDEYVYCGTPSQATYGTEHGTPSAHGATEGDADAHAPH